MNWDHDRNEREERAQRYLQEKELARREVTNTIIDVCLFICVLVAGVAFWGYLTFVLGTR